MRTIFIYLIGFGLLMSCSDKNEEELIDYGSKNTVTVNLPDGKKVFKINIQSGKMPQDALSVGSFYYTDGNSSVINIKNLANNIFLHIEDGNENFNVGEIDKTLDNRLSFLDNTTVYYTELGDNSEYVKVDSLAIGTSITNTDMYWVGGLYNEISLLKGRFEILMRTCDTCPYDTRITGVFHLSNN